MDGTRGTVRSGGTFHDMDLEAYANLYSGYTKIKRLHFIAENCHSEDLALEALRIAHDYTRKCGRLMLYQKTVDMIAGRLGREYLLDQEWVDEENQRGRERLEELHCTLSEGKRHIDADSIPDWYIGKGNYFYNKGDLEQALVEYSKAFLKRPDDIENCFKLLFVKIDLGDLTTVTSVISLLKKKTGSDLLSQAMLRCAAGLGFLHQKNYTFAALKFIGTPFTDQLNNDVIVAEDIASYGGICALATFDRTELKKKVIERENFWKYLSFAPRVRNLILDFCESRYSSFLDELQSLESNLRLDIHFHEHVDFISQQIREKALLQYVHPYKSVDLELMASAFTTTFPDLIEELTLLISTKGFQARIDPYRKIMICDDVSERTTIFRNAREMMKVVNQGSTIRTLLLRLSMKKDEFFVK